MMESISEKALTKALIKQVSNEYKTITRMAKDINNDNILPWKRDKIMESLILKYSPDLYNATTLLRFCTQKSIEDNYNILFKYYCEANKLMRETAKSELKKLIQAEEYAEDDTKFEKEMFATLWRNNDDEYIIANPMCIKLPEDKEGYYCIYFSENHSVKDIERFVETELKYVFTINNATRCYRKLPEGKVIKKFFVGYLTILGMSGKDSAKICDELLPDNITYTEIHHIRAEFIKNNWFDVADKEFYKIIKTKKARQIIDNYTARSVKILEKSMKTGYGDIDFKDMIIPRFLDLSFSEEENKFHLKINTSS